MLFIGDAEYFSHTGSGKRHQTLGGGDHHLGCILIITDMILCLQTII